MGSACAADPSGGDIQFEGHLLGESNMDTMNQILEEESVSDSSEQEAVSKVINWRQLLECIRHELTPLISSAMEATLSSFNVNDSEILDSPITLYDAGNDMVHRVLTEMQKKINLSDQEISCIKGAIMRARKFSSSNNFECMSHVHFSAFV